MVNISNIPNEVALEEAVYATEMIAGKAVTPKARFEGAFAATPGIGALRRTEIATGGYDRMGAPRREIADPSGSYSEEMTFESFAQHGRYAVKGGDAPITVAGAIPGYRRAISPTFDVDDIDSFTTQFGVDGLAWQATGVRWAEINLVADFVGTGDVLTMSATPFIRAVDRLPGFFDGVATGGATNVNEVQSLTITGTPTGGTFTLTLDGQTTAAIAFNATAAAVQTALAALSTIGAGNVACTGGPLPGSAVTITFQGDLGGTNVSQITATGSLTGGTTPTVNVATTTPGSGALTAVMTGAGWTVNQWAGAYVYLDYGTFAGQVRQVLSNTADTLTLGPPNLSSAVTAGDLFHIAGKMPIVPQNDGEVITLEGSRVYLDRYNASVSSIGTTLISSRVLSLNITQILSLARKRRAAGIIGRVGRGARWITGTLRVELDGWDEYTAWEDKAPLSLRWEKDGSVIDATANTKKLARIDIERGYFDAFTPDADNNNRTASFSFVSRLADAEPILNWESVTGLARLA